MCEAERGLIHEVATEEMKIRSHIRLPQDQRLEILMGWRNRVVWGMGKGDWRKGKGEVIHIHAGVSELHASSCDGCSKMKALSMLWGGVLTLWHQRLLIRHLHRPSFKVRSQPILAGLNGTGADSRILEHSLCPHYYSSPNISGAIYRRQLVSPKDN